MNIMQKTKALLITRDESMETHGPRYQPRKLKVKTDIAEIANVPERLILSNNFLDF